MDETIIKDAELVEESKESTSPLPQEEELITFPEAIAEATIGKRIQRIAWPEDEYGFFDEFLMIHRHGKDFIWQVSKGDAVEEDWEIF